MDGDGSVHSAAAGGNGSATVRARCAPAGVPGGCLGSDSRDCLGNGAVLVRWTPAAAETCFGTNKGLV